MTTGTLAVVVAPALLRRADPMAIQADASRARQELYWTPQVGLNMFLRDMLGHDTKPVLRSRMDDDEAAG